MASRIATEIDTLLERRVIDHETAERLRAHYLDTSESSNAVQLAFGAIGAVLLVIGTALLSVYAWDHVTQPGRVVISVVPAIFGLLSLGVAHRRPAWGSIARETSTLIAFVFLGTTVLMLLELLIQAPGRYPVITLWLAAAVPLLVLRHSSGTAVLYTAVLLVSGFMDIWIPASPYTWAGLALAAPVTIHTWRLYRSSPASNTLGWQALLLSLIPVMYLFALTDRFGVLLLPGVAALSACYILAGRTTTMKNTQVGRSITIVGYAIIAITLFVANTSEYWREHRAEAVRIDSAGDLLAAEVLFLAVFLAAAALLIVLSVRSNRTWGSLFRELGIPVSLVLIPVSFVGLLIPVVAYALSILLLIVLGTGEVFQGARNHGIAQLNAGLCIIAGIVALRVFDYDLSLMARGIMFLLIGATATAVNLWFRLFR